MKYIYWFMRWLLWDGFITDTGQTVAVKQAGDLFTITKNGKVTFEENARRGEENRMNYLWSITHRGWLHDINTISTSFASATKYSASTAAEVAARYPELNIIIIPTDEAYRAPMKQSEPSHKYQMIISNISDDSVEVMASRDIPDYIVGSFLNKVVDYFITAEI